MNIARILNTMIPFIAGVQDKNTENYRFVFTWKAVQVIHLPTNAQVKISYF